MNATGQRRSFNPGDFARVQCAGCTVLCLPRDVQAYTRPESLRRLLAGEQVALPIAFLCAPCAVISTEQGVAVVIQLPSVASSATPPAVPPTHQQEQ